MGKNNTEMPSYTGATLKMSQNGIIDCFINESFFHTISDIKARKIPGTHSNGWRMSAHRFLKFWFNIDKTKRGPGNWVDTTNSIKRV